jgi:hypothetical protein
MTTHDTTDTDTESPLQEQVPVQLNGSPAQQIGRLKAYLQEAFPQEFDASNRQYPEHPADLAIRLMTGMVAIAHPQQTPRCQEPYCNKPAQHTDEHGWVNYDVR